MEQADSVYLLSGITRGTKPNHVGQVWPKEMSEDPVIRLPYAQMTQPFVRIPIPVRLDHFLIRSPSSMKYLTPSLWVATGAVAKAK